MMDKKYSIRTHVIWFTLMPLMVMLILLEAFLLHDRYADLDHALIARGQLLARQLAASSEYGVFSGNRMFLSGIAQSALQEPDVKGVAVMNAKPEILVSSGDMSDIKIAMGLVSPQAPVFDNGDVLLLYQPILATQVELNEPEAKPAVQQNGAIVLEMSWEGTQHQKFNLLQFTLLMTAFFLLVTLYLVQITSRRIILPITKLSDAIHAIGDGHLDTRVTVASDIRELCTLSLGINQMTADLQHERAILQQRINEATNQLHELAFFDTLTLLPNRRLLNDRLAQALSACSRGRYHGALLFLDLDNFKPLNDQFGHAVGDLLLIEAARRISSCVREEDTVSRFGGDEFVVMLECLDADHDQSVSLAYRVAEKIRSLLAETYYLTYQPKGQQNILLEHHCTSSIGVVLFMDHHASQEDFLHRADAAMYQAKKEGRNRICFYQQVTIFSPSDG